MATYDFKNGKKRIKSILEDDVDVIEQDKLPKDSEFTFDNAYESWITGIFVDIRDSTRLFSQEDKNDVSRLIRAFTSEIIEILRLDNQGKPDDNLREIGIRGDCVYAVYTTPQKDDIYEIADKSFYVNTFMNMLNTLLADAGYPTIKVGIGVSSGKDLVVKAGRVNEGINNLVWIGSAVTMASKFSGLGNKHGLESLVFSSCTYSNFIDRLKEASPEAESWFSVHNDFELGTYYTANVVKTAFNNWIEAGMK
jgi:class 3 adenylate cyclase